MVVNPSGETPLGNCNFLAIYWEHLGTSSGTWIHIAGFKASNTGRSSPRGPIPRFKVYQVSSCWFYHFYTSIYSITSITKMVVILKTIYHHWNHIQHVIDLSYYLSHIILYNHKNQPNTLCHIYIYICYKIIIYFILLFMVMKNQYHISNILYWF